jgi:hypothetical protein
VNQNRLVTGLAWLTPECRQLLAQSKELAMVHGEVEVSAGHVLRAARDCCSETLYDLLGHPAPPLQDAALSSPGVSEPRLPVDDAVRNAIEQLGCGGAISARALLKVLLCRGVFTDQDVGELIPSGDWGAIRDRLLLQPFTPVQRSQLQLLRQECQQGMREG